MNKLKNNVLNMIEIDKSKFININVNSNLSSLEKKKI